MTYFTYNGRSSADFGLHIEKKDVFSAPEYDAEFISIGWICRYSCFLIAAPRKQGETNCGRNTYRKKSFQIHNKHLTSHHRQIQTSPRPSHGTLSKYP